MFPRNLIYQQLLFCLKQTNFPNFGSKYEGKVRDNYTNGQNRILIATDKLSAFDKIICTIPFKGQVLTQISHFWFEKTKDIVKNHVIGFPDPQVLVCEECTTLPVEMVIRSYLTGVTTTSAWYMYEKGKRNIYGHTLPDGMRKNQKFDQPIITPTTKAPKGQHDEPITLQQIVEKGLMSDSELSKIVDLTKALFRRGQEIAHQNGLILVDTKYEFGKDKNGNLVLIDEIHTPDSSRFWFEDTYEKLFSEGQEQRKIDKEYLREWLLAEGFRGEGQIPEVPDEIRVETASRYIQAYELITAQDFTANIGHVLKRIEQNLSSYMEKQRALI